MTGIDLFAGIGGWQHDGAIGLEIDRDACATRALNGLRTIRADISTWPIDRLAGHVQSLTASPPCQTFSTAGKGEGRDHLPALCAAAHNYDPAAPPDLTAADGKTELVLEPLRWTIALRPEWTAWEQVPAVLPVWEASAHRLKAAGYKTWAGILNAADYGVPQTRRRAILIASRVKPVGPPAPTHAERPTADLFGAGLLSWVSMADALGWTDDVAVVERRGAGMTERYGDRPPTPSIAPYPTVTSGAHRRHWIVRTGDNSRGADGPYPYERSLDAPAPTVDRKAGMAWAIRGNNTIAGGHDDKPVKLTVADALTLQSFNPHMPLAGTRTAQFRQIGNAIPPGLARAILEAAR